MALRLRPWVLAATLISLGACGDDGNSGDSGSPDGGADTGAPDVGFTVAEPIIPWLDEGAPPGVLLPCPDGWREVTVDGVTECDPYAEGGPGVCDAGEAHFPGEPGCRPLGDACPAGDFATTLPTDGSVVYVKAGAAPGGDGSLASPYAALNEVNWLSSGSGTTVALAKGTYEGALPLRPGARVVGACAAETVLAGAVPILRSVVTVTGAGEAPLIRNLSIRNAPQAGVLVERGRAVILEGVLIDTVTSVGVSIAGMGTSVTLRDVVVRDTAPGAEVGAPGRGIEVSDEGLLDAERFIVEGCRDMGLLVTGAGSRAMLADTVVRDMQPNTEGVSNGLGIVVFFGAQVEAQRLLVARNSTAGIFIEDPGSSVSLIDAIVEDTRPEGGDGPFGQGIIAQLGGRLEARRLLIQRNHDSGLATQGAGGGATLIGAVIRDTGPRESDGASGFGIEMDASSHLDAEGLVVQGSRGVGIAVNGEGCVATLVDAVVRDTRSRRRDGFAGASVLVVNGGHLIAERVVFEEGNPGLFGTGAGTDLTLVDAVVRNTRPAEADDTGGRGIQLQGGARFEADRLRIEQTLELGFVAVTGVTANVRDVAIIGTRRGACAATTCADSPFGYGGVSVNSAVSLTRFEVRDAATCGVFLSAGDETTEPSLDLQSGTVSESTIGACIQIDGYDLDRLSNDVQYSDNGSNLEATMLPVP
ncbi:MAG: hypothetical protein DRJ42_16550 [Deltaproteobacteria bacterium]|nr:MAG: hypothetical protein DRJ42_16550 [Deltaproteobacteria bacterium]